MMLTRMLRSVGLMAAMSLIATASSAETKLLLSHIFPSTHPLVTGVLTPWAKDIETATQGRVKIEFAPSSLAPPPGQLDMVQKGIADIGIQFTGIVPNRLHFEMITELPGPTATAEQLTRALWSTHEAYFAKSREYKDLQVLAVFSFPQQDFFCMKACPATLADFKSMKILTTPSTSSKQFGALTSGIVAVPAVRYFEPVSKGTVDAYAGTTAMEVVSLNLAPSTKAILRLKDQRTSGSFVVTVNPASWKKLSAEDQKAIMSQSGAAFAKRMAALDAAIAGAYKKLEDDGIKLQMASAALDADLKKAFDPLDDEWVKESSKRGIDGEAALKHFRTEVVK